MHSRTIVFNLLTVQRRWFCCYSFCMLFWLHAAGPFYVSYTLSGILIAPLEEEAGRCARYLLWCRRFDTMFYYSSSSCSWCQMGVVLPLHTLGARGGLLLLFMLLVPEEGCSYSSCSWCQRRVALVLHALGARGVLLLFFVHLVREEGCSCSSCSL